MLGGGNGKTPGNRLSVLPPKRGTIVNPSYADMTRLSLKKGSGEENKVTKKPSGEDQSFFITAEKAMQQNSANKTNQ